MKPVLLISDTHYHNFTQYAQTDKNGLNTRLGDILRATGEAVKALRAAGGKTIIHCGDVFHVRGNISPTVLNPVLNFYKNLVTSGMDVYMISGNHDLETNEADNFASMATALKSVGVKVINSGEYHKIEGDLFTFVPWTNKLDDLREVIKSEVALEPELVVARKNLIIHAPMNGVIEGLPDHGLSIKDFDGSWYDNVFIGHYHNHKLFLANGGDTYVYSVGALTHQNWGDVDSKAGYCLYYPTKMGEVSHHETSAPKFLKIHVEDLATADNITDNYIKVIGGEFEDPADIEAIRADLIIKGAKAVIVEGLTKRPAVTRAGAAHTGAPTLQTILGDYIDRNYPGETDVKMLALEILGEVYD